LIGSHGESRDFFILILSWIDLLRVTFHAKLLFTRCTSILLQLRLSVLMLFTPECKGAKKIRRIWVYTGILASDIRIFIMLAVKKGYLSAIWTYNLRLLTQV
jgi:hypothetical protein